MKAIVLAGGGGKGAYQIGAWKALKKLNIKYDIVTGTSIGSINAALMTQNNYRKAKNMWKKLNNKLLYDTHHADVSNLGLLKLSLKNVINNDGLNSDNLENLAKKYLNVNKFYNSKIHYGLVATNLTSRKSTYFTKDKIPKDKLFDYIIASCSCYPAFKSKEIDGHKYIDGGYYDNLPINLAIDMKATEIIAVDLKAIGFKRITKKRIPTTIIKPNNKLCTLLDLSQEGIKRNIKFGYNDTMKVFNKYEGKKYTFKLGSIEKNTNKYIDKYIKNLDTIINKKPILKKITKTLISHSSINNKFFHILIEDLAYYFNIDETKIYNHNKLNRLIKKKLKYELKTSRNKPLIKKYQALVNYDFDKAIFDANLFPYELLKAIYLYTITKGTYE